jgi:pSer/pThr/pTyr-binding forkhead associated (FHA) protein
MYTLILKTGSGSSTRFPLFSTVINIGRDPGNIIVLGDTSVSRNHAQVMVEEGAVYVQDMGSQNGTYVNDRKIVGKAKIEVGDKLIVGNYNFVLQEKEDEYADLESNQTVIDSNSPAQTAPAPPEPPTQRYNTNQPPPQGIPAPGPAPSYSLDGGSGAGEVYSASGESEPSNLPFILLLLVLLGIALALFYVLFKSS